MKIYVKASSIDNSETISETIIRMTLSNAARSRGFTRSNDMLKIHFFGIDEELSLIITAALQSIAWESDVSQYTPNISQEDIDSLIAIAANIGVTSAQSAISYLDNNDIGSGEPIVFSVRYNGKLIYRSGLSESSWGKMSTGFVNDSEDVYHDTQYQHYIDKIIKGINKLSPEVVQNGLEFYLNLLCEGSDRPQLRLGYALDKDKWIRGVKWGDADTDAGYIISQARKRVKAVNGMVLKKVPTDTVSNVPAYRIRNHLNGADIVQSGYTILPTKSALDVAKAKGEPYVYVEARYV